MFKNLFKRNKETQSLIKIIDTMQSEEQMIINDLARQVEEKLRSMPRDEALTLIRQMYPTREEKR